MIAIQTMDDKVVPTLSRMDLTAIVNRLEAATSRLEDMAATTTDIPSLNGAAPTPAPTGPLPAPPIATRAADTPKPMPEALPESVENFDVFLSRTVKKFVNLSDEVGGPVAEQVWKNGRTILGLWTDGSCRLRVYSGRLLANANSFSLPRKRRNLI